MLLLVVDTQKGCFNKNLYLFETVKKNIKQLITTARENNVEVVYVQHDDGPGTDLDKSADNYEIDEEFAPRDGEKRVEKNVAFYINNGFTLVKEETLECNAKFIGNWTFRMDL